MKKRTKILLTVLALFIVGCVVLHFAVFDFTCYGNTAVRKYYEVYGTTEEAENPEAKKQALLAELGDYDDYTLNLRVRTIAVFTSYGLTLVGDYEKTNYEKQKEYIKTNYTFATNKDKSIFKYTLDEGCACEFDLNNWHFYLLNEAEKDAEYELGYYIPEVFRMVGFNDKDCKIAFLTYGDSDQDCFGENNDEKDLQEFVNYSFRYNFKK